MAEANLANPPHDEAAEPVWEPGAPSARAMAPSVIFGAIIPLAVYYIVRHFVPTDADGLMIAGAFPALWIGVEWVRRRHIDPIGAITLIGFVVGVIASVALGGNAMVLKVRDSVFTACFGIACLLSLRARRPMMFYIGRTLSAGDDERRRAAFDELWDLPTAPRVFMIITIAWGVGLITEASLRVLLAAVMPTGPFLAASPVLAAVVFGGLFAFTVAYSRRARRLGEEQFLDDETIVYPSVVDDAAAVASPSTAAATGTRTT